MLLQRMNSSILRKISIFMMAFLLGFAALGAIETVSNSFVPVYADSDDMNNAIDNDQDTSDEDDPDTPYNDAGSLEKMVIGFYDVQLNIFGKEIDFSNLSDSLVNFLSFDSYEDHESFFDMYGFFKNNVYPLVQGMAVSLLTLMMMFKFIKECLEVERFSWEKVLMLLAKMFLVNMFIMSSFEILSLFFEWVMDLMNGLTASLPSTSERIVSIGEVFAVGVTEAGWIEKAIIVVIALVMAFAYYGTTIAVVGQVLIRYVKILVGMAFSPLPIAISMDEQHGTDVMRYLFWMTGVFLQAPIIRIFLSIYNQLLAELCANVPEFSVFDPGEFIPFLIGISLVNGLLAMMINMAQQVTDRIMPA